MKKPFKIIGWSIGALLTVFVLGLLCTYQWLSTKWTDFYTENEMMEMAKLVTDSPSLPQKFYQAYDKIYPGQREQTLGRMSFGVVRWVLIDDDNIRKDKQCNCIFAANSLENKVPISYHGWANYVTAHGLEKYTTQAKCLDFAYAQLDLEKCSAKYFDKPLDQLTTDENLELIIRSKSPILYANRPDLLARELSEIKE